MGKKKPDGGWDKTPLPPTQGSTYTLRVVFRSAAHLPAADFGSGSSDPFVLAQCNAGLKTRHKSDPPLRFRTATARRSLNPKWEAEWVIAGIPAAGCEIKARVYDEDSGSRDDLLGRAHIHTGPLEEGWSNEQTYGLMSRRANLRAWGFKSCMKPFSEEARKDSTITVSLQVLGRTEVEVGKAYTVNNFWFTHYSPMLGFMVNTTTPDDRKREAANFQANQLQLRGPVPNDLYLRYVNFHAFVPWMFESKGLRGRILNTALHRQHEEVYHFDAETEYGRLPGPGRAMAQRFLDLTYWGEGHRIFTYVITLDGLMRFTETGPEFGISMLSKHTMHSDVNVYIAFSGEFFVRKYRPDAPGEKEARGHERNSLDIELEDENLEPAGEGRGLAEQRRQPRASGSGLRSNGDAEKNGGATPNGDAEGSARANIEKGGLEVHQHARPSDVRKGKTIHARRRKARETQYDTPPEENTLHGRDSEKRSTDPGDYELVIDNDSGTYRPDKKLLPELAKWLQEQFGNLHVSVLDCGDDVDQKIKKRRIKAKRKHSHTLYMQAGSSSSSLSSSEQEDFAEWRAHRGGKEKGVDFITDPVGFVKEEIGRGEEKLGKLGKKKGKEGKEGKGEKDGEGDDTASVATETTEGTGAGTAANSVKEEAAPAGATNAHAETNARANASPNADAEVDEKARGFAHMNLNSNNVQGADDPEKQ